MRTPSDPKTLVVDGEEIELEWDVVTDWDEMAIVDEATLFAPSLMLATHPVLRYAAERTEFHLGRSLRVGYVAWNAGGREAALEGLPGRLAAAVAQSLPLDLALADWVLEQVEADAGNVAAAAALTASPRRVLSPGERPRTMRAEAAWRAGIVRGQGALARARTAWKRAYATRNAEERQYQIMAAYDAVLDSLDSHCAPQQAFADLLIGLIAEHERIVANL